ncbi:hypothetical protein [Paraburkholderia sp. RL17-381-BIF-C]|uniref:hypothetical protein n=1 Tax=Paraburkholderia sp. RL17-381-BIF-C TaxID=3031635 RepID=UPI0038BC2CB8
MRDSATREREIPHLRAAQKQQRVFDVTASEQIVDADLERGPDRFQFGLAARRHDLEHDLAAVGANALSKLLQRRDRQANVLEADVANGLSRRLS